MFSKCFLLWYRKPSAYLQSYSLSWHNDALRNHRGMHWDAIWTWLPLFFFFLLFSLPLSRFSSFYSMEIRSPPLSWLLSSSYFFHSLYLLYLHTSNLALKGTVFPSGQWTHQLPYVRHNLGSIFILFNSVFPGAVPSCQCLFFWFRLSTCFQVPRRFLSRIMRHFYVFVFLSIMESFFNEVLTWVKDKVLYFGRRFQN